MDGDGVDEIVVGAPLFTNFDARGRSDKGVSTDYETGRIAIYRQTELVVSIFGDKTGGRFGSALAPLGEITKGCLKKNPVTFV